MASATRTAATVSPGAPRLIGSFVVDLTWLSENMGWALAAAPCGHVLCPRIARTDDGGRRWTELPDPPAHLSGPACSHLPCVDQVRFATSKIGYLFGPSLFITHDGGLTWTHVTNPQVESLEPGRGAVVRIVYHHSGCPGPCDRVVEGAPVGSNRWRVLLAAVPTGAAGPEEAVNARVIPAGSQAIYIAVYGNLANGANASQHTAIYRSLNAGHSWVRLADPCGGSDTHERDAIDVAAASGGYLAALCASRYTQQASHYSVITSGNAGTTWGARHPVPASAQFPDLIAAASPNKLLITNSLGGGSGPYTYRLMLSMDGGKEWSTVISDPEQLDANAPSAGYVGFQGSLVGRWIGYPRAIWTTTDGGHHWTRRPFP